MALLYFYFFKNWEENMNRVYKIVWSKAKHAYVVTSEVARSHTKSASGKMEEQLLKRRACPSARFCAPLLLQDA